MPRRPGIYEYDDEIPCRLCGKAFQSISWSHLRSKHHFSGPTAVEDYKRQFGVSRTRSLALEQKRLRTYIGFLESTGNHWTKRRVLENIRARRAAGKPLNHGAVARAPGSLRDAARKFFGTWDKALEFAGVDPWKTAKIHRWTKPLMIKELRACAEGTAWTPRASRHKRIAALRAASRRVFGSWHGALLAAGFQPLRASRTKWTRDEVLRRIKRRVRLRSSLSSAEVARSEPALAAAARQIMGRPWSVVIQSLGYRGHKIVWTEDALRREIRSSHRFGRTSLPGVSKNALRLATQRRFGSWASALHAVGIKSTRPAFQRWTKERVLQRIRERARQGKGLAWRIVLKSEKGLYRAAGRFSGKPWSQLMREMGQDGGSTRIFWTKELVVKEIGRLRRRQPLSPGVTVKKLQMAAWRCFGSWKKAEEVIV